MFKQILLALLLSTQAFAGSSFPPIVGGGGGGGSGPVDLAGANATGVLPITKGGTNAITKSAGFDALSPLTTKGDSVFHNGTTAVRQAGPGPGQVLIGLPLSTTGVGANDLEEASTLRNIGVGNSIGSGAMSVFLRDSSGGPIAATYPSKVSFRHPNAANGGFNLRTFSNPDQLEVPAGASLGLNGSVGTLYVYAIDNGGTVEPAISARLLPENTLTSTVAISVNAQDASTLYSTTARANQPIRLIGQLTVNLSGLGQYVSNKEASSIVSKVPQAAQVNIGQSDWVNYTPTFQGFGTVTNINFQWSRAGGSIKIRGAFTSSGGAAVQARVSLPTSPLNFTTAPFISSLSNSGTWGRGNTVATTNHGGLVIADPNVTYLNFTTADTFSGASSVAYVRATGDAMLGANEAIYVNVEVPIAQYTGTMAASLITKDPITPASSLAWTRITAWPTAPALCVPGTYRSYNHNAGAFTYTDAAPVEAPSAANGFYISPNNYSSAGVSNRYELCLGTQKVVEMRGYANVDKKNTYDFTHGYFGTATEAGIYNAYDPVSGIFYADAGPSSGGITARNLGTLMTSGAGKVDVPGVGYFDVLLYDNPTAVGLSPTKDEFYAYDANGFGSTNAYVRRFLTVVKNGGNAITYTPSATLGDSWTINTAGLYSILYTDYSTTANQTSVISVTANATGAALTANNSAVAFAIFGSQEINNTYVGRGPSGGTVYLEAGTVLRAQWANAAPTNALTARPDLTTFRITKIPSPFEVAGSGGGAPQMNYASVLSGSPTPVLAIGAKSANAQWASIQTVNGTGDYTLALTGYSAPPLGCTCTGIMNPVGAPTSCSLNGVPTATSLRIYLLRHDSSNGAINNGFSLSCPAP